MATDKSYPNSIDLDVVDRHLQKAMGEDDAEWKRKKRLYEHSKGHYLVEVPLDRVDDHLKSGE